MTFRVTACSADDARFEALRGLSGAPSPLCCGWWLQAHAVALGRTVRAWLVLCDDQPVAAMAALEHGRLSKRLGPPPATAYSAVFVRKRGAGDTAQRDAWAAEALAALSKALRPYSAVALPLPPVITDPRGLSWSGITLSPRHTYLVPLAGRTDFLSTFSRAQRKQCAKAERLGIRVREENDVGVLCELLEATSKRAEIPLPLNKRVISRVFDEVKSHGAGAIFMARDDSNAPLAARAVVWGDRVAFDWLAGSRSEGLSTGATPYLLEHVFRECASRGLVAFDFCGANTPSVARFKSGFGGALIGYVHADVERIPFGAIRGAVRFVRRLR